MSTLIQIEELRDGTSTLAHANDDAEVILVRDGAMDPRAMHPRYLIADRDILGTTTLREAVDGDYSGRDDVSDDELNVATLCTVEEIDGRAVGLLGYCHGDGAGAARCGGPRAGR